MIQRFNQDVSSRDLLHNMVTTYECIVFLKFAKRANFVFLGKNKYVRRWVYDSLFHKVYIFQKDILYMINMYNFDLSVSKTLVTGYCLFNFSRSRRKMKNQIFSEFFRK